MALLGGEGFLAMQPNLIPHYLKVRRNLQTFLTYFWLLVATATMSLSWDCRVSLHVKLVTRPAHLFWVAYIIHPCKAVLDILQFQSCNKLWVCL